MADALTDNTIERLGRALLAALTPITGTRATGTLTITAGAVPVSIPVNTYLLPVVGGMLRDDLVFKTTEALELEAHEVGELAITSNVGGARHNLVALTPFRFDPPVFLPHAPTFEPGAKLDASMVDGSDEGALLRSVSVFEDVEEADPADDSFAAKMGDTPSVVLAWIESEPVDGVSAGLRTTSTRAARGKKFYRESFVLYVRAGHLGGDHFRRREGVVLVQAITSLLTDRMQNDDGEQLSMVGGGVEITSRAKLGRSTTSYLYGLRLRMSQVVERYDGRAFARWTATRITGALPGRPLPEPEEPIELVDDTVDMP
jgi:hypothetical protein